MPRTTFISRMTVKAGREQDFVRSVDLAAIPDEIASVSASAQVAALHRVDKAAP